MDTSFGYLPTEQEDMQSLNDLQETLSQESKLLIDVFNREQLMLKYMTKPLDALKWKFLPAFLKQNRFAKWMLFRFFKWREYPSFFLLQKRTLESNCEKLHDLWIIRDKTNDQIKIFNHEVRLYELQQLQGLLENAGFLVNQVYGNYNGKGFDVASAHLILVVHKK